MWVCGGMSSSILHLMQVILSVYCFEHMLSGDLQENRRQESRERSLESNREEAGLALAQ